MVQSVQDSHNLEELEIKKGWKINGATYRKMGKKLNHLFLEKKVDHTKEKVEVMHVSPKPYECMPNRPINDMTIICDISTNRIVMLRKSNPKVHGQEFHIINKT